MADQPALTRRRNRFKIGCGVATVLTGIFLLALSYGFGSPIHWSDDIHGRVIDEETGKPIAGAAVCAKWLLAGFSGSEVLALYKTAAVTDAQGRFVLRRMPIRVRPPFTWFGDDDPQLCIYRPGYIPEFVDNRYRRDTEWPRYRYARSGKRRCDWDGKAVPLQRAKSPQQEARIIDSVWSYLSASAGPMTAKDFPKVWQILVEGHRRLPLDIRAKTPDPQQKME